ncbi:WRKY transcription factor 55 [Raphanus sativus]|nr:WRKY transcription factor 55 [Raphanus sativus]
MEEIMSMIFNGINLVKELEFSLSAQESPESLSTSLGSVSTLFGDANERLKILLARRNSLDYSLREGVMQGVKNIDSGPGCSFSTPRPRRRQKDVEEEKVFVAAARMGNMDTPPDDNHTWRKYGQKEILGFKFPRAYYRCTHEKLYKCPAKKQVQRLDEDPYTFCVTYRSSHTCHFFTTSPISSTAATATTDGHYGSTVVNMAEALFGNVDSVVPFDESYFDYRSLFNGSGSDWDT